MIGRYRTRAWPSYDLVHFLAGPAQGEASKRERERKCGKEIETEVRSEERKRKAEEEKGASEGRRQKGKRTNRQARKHGDTETERHRGTERQGVGRRIGRPREETRQGRDAEGVGAVGMQINTDGNMIT